MWWQCGLRVHAVCAPCTPACTVTWWWWWWWWWQWWRWWWRCMAACSTHRAGGADDEDRLRGVPLEELGQRLSPAWREDARLQLAVEAELCGELLRPCGVLRDVVGGHHDALDGKRRLDRGELLPFGVLVLAPLALGAALRWKRFSDVGRLGRVHVCARR